MALLSSFKTQLVQGECAERPSKGGPGGVYSFSAWDLAGSCMHKWLAAVPISHDNGVRK